MNNRVRAFADTVAGRAQAAEVGYWLKAASGNDPAKSWCVDHGIPLTRASGESGNAAGGWLVPQVFQSGIINVREKVSAFRNAEVRTVDSNAAIRPRKVGGLTANWVSEAAVIPESSFQLDALEPDLRKLAILGRTSSELFDDSAEDLGQFLTTEVGYAFGGVEDDTGFNGDGSATYEGQIGLEAALTGKPSAIVAAAGHDTFGEVDKVDIGNLMAGVLGSSLTAGAQWFMSPSAYALVACRLSAETGGLVMGPSGPSWMGYPVVFSSKLPDVATTLTGRAMFYFGNLQMSSLLCERRQTIVALSWQRAAEHDQILFRAVERIHIINHSIGDASTRGPIAMLVGA